MVKVMFPSVGTSNLFFFFNKLEYFKISHRHKNSTTYYQGSSATTSGWLKILAALARLLVGIGSPLGV